MEVLLVGNTDFITKQWIQHSFPRDHVVIAEREGTVDGNDRLRIVNMSDANTLAETLTTYEFDRIVFFSEGLTPRSERDGDLGYLRRLLHAIRNRSTQMLMVCGPESEFTYPENADVRDTSKSLMSRASEELCLYYARTYRLEAKIIRCPYLYAPERNGATAYFGRLFEQASAGSISFCERKQQQTCFLCADDLAELIYRMFDDWTAESEIFHVPNVFDFTYGDLADAISAAFPGLSVTFGEDRPQHYPADDHVLRLRYGWSPRYSLKQDLPPCASALERSACSGTIQEAPGLGFSTQPFKTMDRNRNLHRVHIGRTASHRGTRQQPVGNRGFAPVFRGDRRHDARTERRRVRGRARMCRHGVVVRVERCVIRATVLRYVELDYVCGVFRCGRSMWVCTDAQSRKPAIHA